MESKEQIKAGLVKLFEQWSGRAAETVLALAPSGSNRQYYRLHGGGYSAIGTYGAEPKENRAFLAFSRHFKTLNLPVPEIYASDEAQQIYLQEDFGDDHLYGHLPQLGEDFSPELLDLYRKSVRQLAQLQIRGGQDVDYSLCYPRAAFDEQSILWDFNTFKYYFVKLIGVPFEEEALEVDISRFAQYLLEADSDYFMFRDFQSRNIMLRDGAPFFIDYQGGRKGALQYDLASLLFQAKANLSEEIREELLQHYLDEVEQLLPIDREKFIAHFYAFVLIRCIQVLGTYGFRGLYERKSHFLASIPFALKNLRWLLRKVQLPQALPELWRTLEAVANTNHFTSFDRQKGVESPLTVYVTSFSYKFGMPEDKTDNGGGFVFDCRCLHNPGRYEPYKTMTGLEKPVIEFLEAHSNIKAFVQNCFFLIDEAVQNYLERQFSSLMISYGCTGGQHRSVYSAERTKEYLEQKYGVKVVLRHLEGDSERNNWRR